LKPSNILVAPYDDNPVPKVIDFGLAKAMHQSLTERTLHTAHETVLGTPLYMSPEQAQLNNLDVDTRSDIYSLGVLLYELLTGTTPLEKQRFQAVAWDEIRRIIREEEPPRPSIRLSSTDTLPSLAARRHTEPDALTRLIRGDLDWIAMKALEKDRARRYDTANSFAADVLRYLSGEPVLAAPSSVGYRVRKFVWRHRTAVLTATAIALLVVVGTAVSTWQAIVATRAKNEAIEHRNLATLARNAEAAARKRADDARKEAARALVETRETNARMFYERAQALCEEGKADLGLLWMARSLEVTPAGSTDLDRAIRMSMNLWTRQHATAHATPPGFDLRQEAGNSVSDVAASPDGLKLLTFDTQGVPRLFDAATGKPRFTLPFESDAPPGPDNKWDGKWCPAFSADGRLVAATREDRRVRIWSTVTGRLVSKPLVHDELVRGISFDPTGRSLASAAGKQIRFWSVDCGEPEGEPLTVPKEVEREFGGVEISVDGRALLAWTHNDPARDQVFLWELPSRKPYPRLEKLDFLSPIHHACLSPDGRIVLVSGYLAQADRRFVRVAQFWEVASGKPVGASMKRDPGNFIGMTFGKPCFRPDGRIAVTGGYPTYFWQVPSGKPVGTANQIGLSYGWRRAFTPDGRVLIAVGTELLKDDILDVPPALVAAAQIAVPSHRFQAFAISPNGKWVVTANDGPSDKHDGTIPYSFRLFDLNAGKAIGAPIDAKTTRPPFFPVAFSPDGSSLATLGADKTVQLWDSATARKRGPRLEMTSPVGFLTFSHDGRLLAVGGQGGDVRIWEVPSGQPVGPPIAHGVGISRLCFGPDDSKLLIGGLGPRKQQARIWDVGALQPFGPPLDTLTEVNDAAFSPDGKTFLIGSFSLTLRNTDTSEPVWKAPGFRVTWRLAFSPDGRHVLATFLDEPVAQLFDARTGMPTGPPLRHKEAGIMATFSRDGRLVLTSSADLTARLWDTSTALPVGPPWTNLSSEPRGCFTPDGRSVLLYEDGMISRWDFPEPLEGAPERIRLAVEAATRYTLDPYGATLPLHPVFEADPTSPNETRRGSDRLESVRNRLLELGGPPGFFRR
jgi:WD40 repeat protein